MPRGSIRQFRTSLAARGEQGSVVRAYRELARRPQLAAGMVRNEWALWTNSGVSAAA